MKQSGVGILEVLMRRESKLYTAAVVLAAMALVLSASIAVPLLWRGFYYLHIDAMELPAQTGWTAEEIRGAFDEMMDYCVYRQPFGTGVLKWSEEGYAHFRDCELLFRLDFTVLAVALASVLLLWLMRSERKAVCVLGRGPLFWAGAGLAGLFAVIAGLAALDFDRAFVVFHTLFFPGKSNWIFDYRTDEIILVLPQDFFMHCGMLIVGCLFIGCAGLIIADRKRK